jgi:hypothetical protein
MKKIKLDPNKIIKIPPRMENDGPDVNLLLVIIIGIALGLFLISCNEQSKVKEKPIGLRQKSDEEYTNVTEYTYGGCEYIKVGYLQNAWGSHKGNCSNPIHKK